MDPLPYNPLAKKMPDWSLEEMRILRELYPTNNSADLKLFLNRSENAINLKAFKLGIRKSEDFMNSPASGRFLKKTEPWYRRLFKRLVPC